MTQIATQKDASLGQGYQRPAKVETQIASLEGIASDRLTERVKIRSVDNPEHILTETLIYLTRRALKQKEQKLGRLLLSELTERCFRILRNKVKAGAYADRDTICEEIIGEFVVLFAKDCAGQKTPLDYYECRFNLAFSALRIDNLRAENTRKENIVAMPTTKFSRPDDAASDVSEIVVEALRTPPTQETEFILSRLSDAVNTLPTDQRNAFVLVRLLGYKIHSKNPDEVTATTRCQCDERTVRNRLKRADIALASIMEDLHDQS